MRLGRRAALLAPLALGGCSLWDEWFSTKKTPPAGKREIDIGRTWRPGCGRGRAQGGKLPPAVSNASWPQAGGNPAHFMGHLAASERLAQAWTADIGAGGGGYRRKIMAQPVAENGIVYVMDSDAVVSAFDIAGGGRVWRFDTKNDEDDSSNIGGGLAVDQGTLHYAVNGLAEAVALDAAKGASARWRAHDRHCRLARSRPWSRWTRVRHHDRGQAGGAGGRRWAAALDPPVGDRDDQCAGTTGAGVFCRLGGRRVRFGRSGDNARRYWQRGVDRQPGSLGA